MTTCAVQGQIYAGDGAAMAVVGRPAVLVLRLRNPVGGYFGLTGRVFRQVVLSAGGDELIEAAVEPYDAEGVKLTLTGDQIASLLPADRPSIDLLHTVEEITDDGAVELFTRRFSVRRKASGAPAAILTVGNGGCDQVVVSFAGASAPSPFAEWLAQPGNEGGTYEAFLASINSSDFLGKLGAIILEPNRLVRVDQGGEVTLAPLATQALDLLAATTGAAQRAAIGAASAHDAALTGAPTAPTPADDDDGQRLATTEWARDRIEAAGNDLVTGLAPSFAAKADKTRTVTGGGLATGGGDLTADRVITVTEASDAEALAGAAADKVMTPRRAKTAIDASVAASAALKADKARTVTGGGLVTGGGDLTADRVLTVTEASDAEALAGDAADKVMTPRRSKAAIDASAATKADKTRSVTGAGLAMGGGDLTADRVITVTEASDAEALAGAAADKVMTPRRSKTAIDASAATKADKTRTVTGAGLATGGGDLTADRVITVTEASDPEALAGAAADKVMTPRRAKTAIDASAATKADKTRTVTGAGLATGGGDLTADRVITVTEASDAEALAGAASDKVMTPRRAKTAIDASVATSAALKADKVRTVTGAGLATGGGDLTADRVITVTEASDAEALAGAAADKVMTPRRAKTAIDASAAAKADKTRTVTGAGLATGGGDLTADRVITVTEASDAEALAGVASDRVMTPRRAKTAIDASAALKADKTRTVTGAGLATGGGDLTADRVITVTEASDTEATTGTAADKVMTPRRTKTVTNATIALLRGELAAARVMAQSAQTPAPLVKVADLPAVVTGLYLCNEGGGTLLHDVLGGANIDLTTGAGYAWQGGVLTLTNGWFKTASRTAQSMFIVYQTNEGSTNGGYYLSSPSGRAYGDNYTSPFSLIPDIRVFTGHNIRPMSRNNDAGGYATSGETGSGGWTGICATMVSSETGAWAIGAGNTSGAGPAVKMRIVAIGFGSAQLTDGELLTVRDFLRSRCAKRRIYLTPWDCPIKAKLLVLTGESTAHGTKGVALLSASDRALYNDLTYILAADSGTVAGRRMEVLRFAAGVENANAPGNTNAFGMELGVLKSRLAQSSLPYRLDILKPGIGSTTEVASGSYSNALGGTTVVSVSTTRYSGETRIGGLFHGVEHQQFLHAEAVARNDGVGYETVVVFEAGWLNACYIGTGAVTGAALVQTISQAMYDFRKTYWGVPNLQQISLKPHEPWNGLGGGDADYPNNAAGADRLTALGYARAGLVNFAAANSNVVLLDGNDYALDTPTDPVHPGTQGYIDMGTAVEQKANWAIAVEAA